MVNRRRGEVSLCAGNRQYTLCLTLGALAELEDAYGGEDILAIADRFSSGNLGSKDAINLLRASMRGGGVDASETDIANLTFEDGMAGLIRTLADLLLVTFAADPTSSQNSVEATDEPVPFPGASS